MNNNICTFHPVTDGAWSVFKDPRNANQLVQVDAKKDGDTKPQSESALSLSVDRAPKRGRNFIIGRHRDADIVLTDPTTSSRHCSVSITNTGVPLLRDQSTNGTLLDGRIRVNQVLEVCNGMQIQMGDATFDIRVPWRGNYQEDYEYKAKRANESRGGTPLETASSRQAPIRTIREETLGSYTLTNTTLLSSTLNEKVLDRTELVSRGSSSFFVAKRFNREGLGRREARVWREIKNHKIEHVGVRIPEPLLPDTNSVQKPNIVHLEEFFENDSGLVMILEMLPNGNFHEIFCPNGDIVPHDIVVCVMSQLLSALEYLHKLNIVHSAVRSDQLLVSSRQPICVKLTGFEWSHFGDQSLIPTTSVCPAPECWEGRYRNSVAPHIWENLLKSRGYPGERSRPLCGSPMDIWDAGVVCSQLTLGKSPCYLDSGKQEDEQVADYVDLLLTARLESSTERSEIWAQKLGLTLSVIRPLLLKFLQKLLDPESKSRATAEDCLTDVWLKQHARNTADNVKEPRVRTAHVQESARKRRKLDTTS